MALQEITQGTGFWQPFRPNYTASVLSDITGNLELLAGKFIQMPDRSIYYVTDEQEYFQAFDEKLRPLFIQTLISSNATYPIKTVTTSYAVGPTDHTILCDATAAAFDVTLLDPTTCEGQIFAIKKIDATGNPVTITGATIENSPDQTLDAPLEGMIVQSNGLKYLILSIN